MVGGILFDKDGTLFHFRDTFSVFVQELLIEIACGDRARAVALGRRIGFDLETAGFGPQSVAVTGTPEQIAHALLPDVPDWDEPRLVARMNAAMHGLPLVPAAPLVPLVAGLIARGLRLGVVTNDALEAAEAHLTAVGIRGAFEFVAGYDSGHGAKPDPGMLHEFRRRTGLAPERIAMVGDSRHDLAAGRAAGMRTVGVLTGMATTADLDDLADVILPDIGALPGWIDALG
ncbi:phosphatase [Maritimibacter sp. 55A14]|uniref:HAD family hydrolase n=1 Tax=Maritimibacter sp. 55A14 TaxID=2174844 RepID=UPI000D610A05|nr:HAD family hydrolase [Maritimibacter sp. 55A14]PWE29278.1 phosphatase [Maritimibacter sp. 55A14]